MNTQPYPDPQEERKWAEQLGRKLRSLKDVPPPSLEPGRITALLQEETPRVKRDGKAIRHWLPLLASCAAAVLLVLPLSRLMPQSKNASSGLDGDHSAVRGSTAFTASDPECTGSAGIGEAERPSNPDKDGSHILDETVSPTASASTLPPKDQSLPESDSVCTPQRIASEEALKLQTDGILLVDVRPADTFVLGHISGAVNIPLESLSKEIGVYLSPGDSVIVYCSAGDCSEQAARQLTCLGYVAYDLGSMDTWPYEKAEGAP